MTAVVVDTTAICVFTMDAAKNEDGPARKTVEEALKPLKITAGKFEKVTRPKAAAVYEVVVDGLG